MRKRSKLFKNQIYPWKWKPSLTVEKVEYPKLTEYASLNKQLLEDLNLSWDSKHHKKQSIQFRISIVFLIQLNRFYNVFSVIFSLLVFLNKKINDKQTIFAFRVRYNLLIKYSYSCLLLFCLFFKLKRSKILSWYWLLIFIAVLSREY